MGILDGHTGTLDRGVLPLQMRARHRLSLRRVGAVVAFQQASAGQVYSLAA